MQAKDANLLDLLSGAKTQFQIPIYQRKYTWGISQCAQLWNDIITAGKNEDLGRHFIGSIVYIQEKQSNESGIKELLVIDGQQRITTFILLLEALARHMEKNSMVLKSDNAKTLRDSYLFTRTTPQKLKLILTQQDQVTLESILNNIPFAIDVSPNLKENFEFFQRKIYNEENLNALYQGICGIRIIDVALTKGEDNPQLIFESLNSTGKKLDETDLIRNFILMGLNANEQNELYTQYWKCIETMFLDMHSDKADYFFRDYLTIEQGGQRPKIEKIYEDFKRYHLHKFDKLDFKQVKVLLEKLCRFAGFYGAITGLECKQTVLLAKTPQLQKAFTDLRKLNTDPLNSFLMQVFELFDNGKLSEEDFTTVVRLLESYLIRRLFCGLPANTFDKTFATLFPKLDLDNFVESLKVQFCLMANQTRFPSDDEFCGNFKIYRLYGKKYCNPILFRLENFESKEQLVEANISIEHVLPQNIENSEEWQRSLGENWEDAQKMWVHTIGNLTLTGYNIELQNASFQQKKNMPNGYLESKFALTKSIADKDQWTIAEIQDRAELLSKLAVKVWEFPKVPAEILVQKRAERAQKGKVVYTLDSYRRFQGNSHGKYLFEFLDRKIKEIFPELKQFLWKEYISYKLKWDVCAVIPQKSKLTLSINLEFNQIHDPKHLCRDVTNMKRWTSGNAEIAFTDESQLDDIMAIIEQAYQYHFTQKH